MTTKQQPITAYSFQTLALAKLSDYAMLVKIRLNLTVVFSAVIGYLLAAGQTADIQHILALALGGFTITGSANALNQVLEKDYDKMMLRTAQRPLAAGRMGMVEAVLVAGLLGIIGIVLLWTSFNDVAALLGALSLFSYAFLYTPLKRLSPIAILVGAVPGALPPLIGWVAYSGKIDFTALVLFAIQFLWQFPHFWAIGWLGADAYKKAGFKLYPQPHQKDKGVALQVLLYVGVLTLLNLSLLPLGLATYLTVVAALILGIMFAYFGWRLYRQCTDKAALQLMFASIIYLPVLQVVMLIDRLFFVVQS